MIGKMAATVGHEIRNPLTSLKGFTQLQQKNSNFFAEEIIHIECNEKQMHYTLVHIIKKVIKETKYGSCINIGTYLISKNHILIYIADERCEISKKKLENSMDIFGVEKASDFGLGLMAVYKIVVVDKGVLI
ncbi:histidine kinase dimerization/phospho-acceptor domain-containing protein [Bacillus sp. JJ864]|uniref:histidine kinase dimerization/phospho-acceptor domain-containing protein n=1 Tax=Bacillus sp. JJ864 TaxID=3122975 RepID=UPI00300095DA